MRRLAPLFCACLLTFGLYPVRADNPVSPQDLLSAGRLQVEAAIHPARGIVPGQKLRLILEIATDRWFTGGTRIGIPEVPGLVILQSEQFASNASENRSGQSWVLQRWTLDVYAQRAGGFTVPAITLDLEVNAGEAGNLSGRIMSPPVSFTANVPASLDQVQQWVAAPEFKVSQNFDRSLEGLKVGEAFEREIVFEASDLMAMMLPELELGEIPGLAIYPSPARLDNSSNRGETRASRRQRITYVLEADGEYLLPGGDFAWWDTQENQLKMVSLPVTELRVGAGPGTQEQTTNGPLLTRKQWLLLLGGVAALVIALWLGRALLARLPLAACRDALQRVWHFLGNLLKPALPSELNPGSSAGE